MEHRYLTRFPFSLDIELSNCDGLIGFFKTCDISGEGVGIEGNFIEMKINKLVTVKIIDPRLEQTYVAKGQVVYSSVMKMGIIFTRYQNFVDELSRKQTAVA